MAVYVYETTDETQPPRRFELSQSMRDEPYTHHPETGEPIRRVISGGFGYMAKGGGGNRRGGLQQAGGGGGGGGCCGGGCACH